VHAQHPNRDHKDFLNRMLSHPYASLTLRSRTAREFVYRAGPRLGVAGRIASFDAAVRRRRAP